MLIKEEAQQRAQGSRGKYAEKAVKDYLTALGNSVANFDWGRRYDARSAGGRFPSQPGDFEYYRLIDGRHCSGLIEVKEVAHDFRLPAKNFKKEQIARLRKRVLAGCAVCVLIYHSTIGKWRRVPLEKFVMEASAPSWDLSQYKAFQNLQELLFTDEALMLGVTLRLYP